MSGVLDRMLERARGELPRVEPLVPSQRTAAGAAATLAAQGEGATAGGSVPDPLRERHTASRRAARTEASGGILPAGDRDAERSQRAERAASDSRRSGRAEEAQTPRMEARRNAWPRKDTGAAFRDSGESQAELPRATRHVVETESTHRAVSLSPGETPEASPPSGETHGEADAPPDETTAGREQRFRESGGARAEVHAPAPLAEGGEQTEIHITIGAIELRAPQMESKARPFRPRVSLDEFLQRKAGRDHE